MYNLIGYSSNYSDTTGQIIVLDEATNVDANIVDNNTFKFFEYKAKLLENTVVDGNNSVLKNAAIAVLLTYVSNFQRLLEVSLINCKVELKLR